MGSEKSPSAVSPIGLNGSANRLSSEDLPQLTINGYSDLSNELSL